MSTPLQRKLFRCANSMNLPLSSEWNATSPGVLVGTGRGDLREWNPHANDKDAFELLCALGIRLFFYENVKTVLATYGGNYKITSLKRGRARAVRAAIVEVVAMKSLDKPDSIA